MIRLCLWRSNMLRFLTFLPFIRLLSLRLHLRLHRLAGHVVIRLIVIRRVSGHVIVHVICRVLNHGIDHFICSGRVARHAR